MHRCLSYCDLFLYLLSILRTCNSVCRPTQQKYLTVLTLPNSYMIKLTFTLTATVFSSFVAHRGFQNTGQVTEVNNLLHRCLSYYDLFLYLLSIILRTEWYSEHTCNSVCRPTQQKYLTVLTLPNSYMIKLTFTLTATVFSSFVAHRGFQNTGQVTEVNKL